MDTIFRTRIFQYALVVLGGLCLAMSASASQGDFYTSYTTRVVGHLSLPGNHPVRQMLLQQEGRQQYLYVRQASQSEFTVLNVTKPDKPKVVDHLAQRNLTMVDSGLAISETPDPSAPNASSVTGHNATNSGPESIRVLDISDPAHPRTVETFNAVTSILRDDANRRIYVANQDGIWILSHERVLRRHMCSSSDAISSAIPNCD